MTSAPAAATVTSSSMLTSRPRRACQARTAMSEPATRAPETSIKSASMPIPRACSATRPPTSRKPLISISHLRREARLFVFMSVPYQMVRLGVLPDLFGSEGWNAGFVACLAHGFDEGGNIGTRLVVLDLDPAGAEVDGRFLHTVGQAELLLNLCDAGGAG